MINLRSRSAAVALSGGLLVIGGLAVAPAFAYPAASALTISCDALTYAPSATAVCTLENIDPNATNTGIFLGNPPLAQGAGATFALASLAAQDSTFVQDVQLPATPGIYTVVGESGDETASTTVEVVSGGAVTAFGVVVNSDGSVKVEGATAGCSVTVFVNGTAVGTATVGADGTVTIPAGVTAGQSVTASQTASDACSAMDAAAVVAPEGTGGGGGGSSTGGKESGGATTPKTGADVTLGVIVGLGALGVGGGLFVASRRRKS